MKSVCLVLLSVIIAVTTAIATSLATLNSIEYWTSVVEIKPGVVQAYVMFNVGPFTYKKNLDVKMVSLEEHYERTYSRGEGKKKD